MSTLETALRNRRAPGTPLECSNANETGFGEQVQPSRVSMLDGECWASCALPVLPYILDTWCKSEQLGSSSHRLLTNRRLVDHQPPPHLNARRLAGADAAA